MVEEEDILQPMGEQGVEDELTTAHVDELARDLTSELPEFTTDVLKRVSLGLGLVWNEAGEPAPARVLYLGPPQSDRTIATRPPFQLPGDIHDIWKSSTPQSFPTFARSLRVSEEDFRALLQTPRIDAAVGEHLPHSVKATASGYSPFWESELSSLDGRLSTAVRLGSVATTVSDHLSRTLSAQGGSDHPLVKEAMLLGDLSMHLTSSVMSARRRITQLRRQQIVTQLTSEFGTNFMSQHMNTVQNNRDDASSEHLFDETFCENLAVRT